jgi:hypothetical protein
MKWEHGATRLWYFYMPTCLLEGVVEGIELRVVNDRSFTYPKPDPDPQSCTLGGLG